MSVQSYQITVQQFKEFVEHLAKDQWQVIGPRERDRAIFFETMTSIEDLPQGRGDIQGKGSYKLIDRSDQRFFGFNQGSDSLKRWFFPKSRKLFSISNNGEAEPPKYEFGKRAFIGIRGCDLAAITIQDKVFTASGFCDPEYAARRSDTLLVSVNCSVSADTCFCTSQDTGPRILSGYDLCLTEFDEPNHGFIVETGSTAGDQFAQALNWQPVVSPVAEETIVAETQKAIDGISRRLPKNIKDTLATNLKSTNWQELSSACLSCANCTLVCPTGFCQSVEDKPDMDMKTSERWAEWDSCFNADHSYIHGGVVRQTTADRYRQWMVHKLSTWHDQFGSSGCTGCGRCIAWCPVGIDITELAQQIEPQEKESHE